MHRMTRPSRRLRTGVLLFTFLSLACLRASAAEDAKDAPKSGEAVKAAASAGAEWARFRGPNGSGLATTAFDRAITEQDFLWKVKLPGKGHSSPAIADGRVYLTSSEVEGSGARQSAKRIVLCLSAADGSVLWQRDFTTPGYKQHGDNSYASSSPTLDEQAVYLTWTTPEEVTLLALTHDGKDLWKQTFGRYISQHGSGVSPVVVEDAGVVVLTIDQEGPRSLVVAVDRNTGQPRWKIDREQGKMSAATPCLYQPKGKPPKDAQLILSCNAHGITSVDPRSGNVLWEVPDAFTLRTVASPVFAESAGLVIATAGEGRDNRQLVAVRPPAAPGGEPEVVYKLTRTPPYVPTPLVKGDVTFLWGDAGTVTAIHTPTGKTAWTEKVGGDYYGSPVLTGDTIWCMSRKGELVGIGAADEYKLVGKLNLGETCHATPAVAGGRMYLRTVSHLIAVGKK